MKNSISPQKKEHSIRYALDHPERALKELAQELGVGYSSLQKWVRQARRDGLAGSSRQLSAEQLEITRLKKEIAHLREVNEIVKKAHVYFVNNPNR
jgi:transposase-like protein